jgi:hypothetical protein
MVAAPHVGDAYRQGRTGHSNAWVNKLAEMKSKHLRSTIKVPQPGRREI